MSKFYFMCPHCNAKICAEGEMIGQTAPCPSCKKTVIVRQNITSENKHGIPPRTPTPGCGSAAAKSQNDYPAGKKRINYVLFSLLILLNIQFAILLYFIISNQATMKNKGKITECQVKHFDREQFTFGLKKEVDKMIQDGYEPIGKLCNDGINGAYYLFIKREN